MLETAAPKIHDSTQEVDDDALVQAIRSDPAQFAVLYRRYALPVYRYLYGRVGNAKDAEDLTSQVFLEVLESLPRYRSQGSFAAWLFTLARRRAIDLHRRQRPQFRWIGLKASLMSCPPSLGAIPCLRSSKRRTSSAWGCCSPKWTKKSKSWSACDMEQG
jgi:DNA-directed RNA polymerase specialized sigma24 family protein